MESTKQYDDITALGMILTLSKPITVITYIPPNTGEESWVALSDLGLVGQGNNPKMATESLFATIIAYYNAIQTTPERCLPYGWTKLKEVLNEIVISANKDESQCPES